MLKIAIPKGSLEDGTFRLFDQAGLTIKRRNDRDYNLSICDPRIKEAFMLRPPEVAKYVDNGEFDLGITGLDWVRETGVAIKEVADLQFSRGGWGKVKIVFATYNDNPVERIEDINSDSKVVTEYPRLTRNFLKRHGKGKVSIRMSYGATEVKVPRLAHYLVDVTETGITLRENGKKIMATIMESSTKLIANQKSWDDPAKRQAMLEISSLLLSVIEARGRVLLKMNIAEDGLDTLVQEIVNRGWAMKSPTVSRLYLIGNEKPGFALETVVPKSNLNIIIPEIQKMGATDILEVDVSKVIP